MLETYGVLVTQTLTTTAEIKTPKKWLAAEEAPRPAVLNEVAIGGGGGASRR